MNTQSDRIAIEFISVMAMPPVEFVHLAADLDCRHIGLALAPISANPHNYPAWSLRDDRALLRQTIGALGERGVSVSLGEGFLVRPGADVRDMGSDLEIMRELGAVRVNTLSIDPDRSRSLDQIALFAEMASALGFEATLEFLPGLDIGNLESALLAVRHVGRPDFRLLIDVMHLIRSGSSAADLAALDPEMIGYVQLCDVPLVSKHASYGEEARDDRLPPGRGELPLRAILSAVPEDVIVGLEVPMLSAAKAGIGPRERLQECVEATRKLLEGAT